MSPLKTLLSILTLSAMPTIAQASEGGGSPLLRGTRSFGAGFVPPQPGVYVSDTVYVNSGDADATVLQGRAQVDVEVQAVVNIAQATVVYPFKLGDLTVASSVTLPLSNIELSGTLVTPIGNAQRREEGFGFGDLVVTPVILGFHSKKFHASASVSLFLPTGEYSRDDIVNTGRNTTSVAPSIALSYIDPKSGWDASLATSYVIIGRNKISDYNSGDLLQFDAAIGKQLDPTLKIGLAGYAVIQTTGDSGGGASFGAFKNQIYGIGPAVSYGFKLGKQPLSLGLRYYQEFGARNTFEGQSVYISLSTKI